MKKKKKVKRSLSLVEKIRRRSEAEDEGIFDSPYFQWPPFPGEKRLEKIKMEFVLLGNDFGAGRFHWIKDTEGKWHKVRCRKDRFLPKSQRGKCLCCDYIAREKKLGRMSEAEAKRMAANTSYKFCVMYKHAKPWVDENTGESKCRLIDLPWSVWKAIKDDFIDEGGDPRHDMIAITRVAKKKTQSSKRAQISYRVGIGSKYKMPKKWKRLQLWDFDELDTFSKDEDIMEWLGIDEEEVLLGMDEKGDNRSRRPKKRTEEDIDFDEDFDED